MRSTCFSGLGVREVSKGVFPVWLGEGGPLVWHVRTQVVLYVSHPPAGQLVLGQVQAEAAQLENCGLGFWSLGGEGERKDGEKTQRVSH